MSSTSFFPDNCRAIQKASTYEDLDSNWMDYLKKTHPKGEDQIRSLLSQFQKMAETYDDMNFTPPYLATIQCPTLIIHGDRDAFFPVDIPVTSYKSIPNSFLWIVPNSGHNQIGKNSIWADSFLQVLDEFISGKWK